MSEKLLILDFIFKSCEDSRKTISEMINICKNPDFVELLYKLYKNYDEFFFTAKNFLENEFITPVSLNVFEEFGTKIMIKLLTVNDKSSSKISETLIKNIEEILNETINLKTSYEINHEINNEILDEMVLNFINDFIFTETNNIALLEKFL